MIVFCVLTSQIKFSKGSVGFQHFTDSYCPLISNPVACLPRLLCASFFHFMATFPLFISSSINEVFIHNAWHNAVIPSLVISLSVDDNCTLVSILLLIPFEQNYLPPRFNDVSVVLTFSPSLSANTSSSLIPQPVMTVYCLVFLFIQ